MVLKTIQRMKPRSDFNYMAIVCDKAYVRRCTEWLDILPPSDLLEGCKDAKVQQDESCLSRGILCVLNRFFQALQTSSVSELQMTMTNVPSLRFQNESQ